MSDRDALDPEAAEASERDETTPGMWGAVAAAGPFRRSSVVPVSGDPAILRVRDADFRLSAAQRVNLVSPVAWGYERLWRPRSVAILTGGELHTEAELTRLAEWVQPAAGERILDAGCSAGLYARRLSAAAPGAELHAVDVSLPFLQEGRRLAQCEGHAVQFVQADVQHLPYRDGAFDAIVSGGSLNEFRDPAAALEELVRVLVPGGRLFLMYVSRAEGRLGRVLQGALGPSGLSFPSPGAVDAWAIAAGLSVERFELRAPIVLALFRKRPHRSDKIVRRGAGERLE